MSTTADPQLLLNQTLLMLTFKEMLDQEIRKGRFPPVSDIENNGINFDKGKLLGKGSSMTRVYQGTFGGNRTVGAVKVVRFLESPSEQALKEIADLMRVPHHRNLVNYHAIAGNMVKGHIRIAMTLCKMNLASWVSTRNNTQFSRIDILRQLTKGVEYLHSVGVIHGGLKPTNCFLKQMARSGDVLVQISDFGLSREERRNSFTYNSPGWTCPEVLNQRSNDQSRPQATPPAPLTPSADIFPLGCLYYYVLSGGGHPFTHDRNRQSYYMVENKPFKEPIILQGTHFGNVLLVKSMINPDPKERPSCSAILSHPLFWTNEKVFQFFIDILRRRDYSKELSRIFESAATTLTSNSSLVVPPGIEWHELLCPHLLPVVQRHCYVENSMASMLSSLANIASIYKSLPKNIKTSVGSSSQDFILYCLDRFPFLINLIWMGCGSQGLNFKFDLTNGNRLLKHYFESESGKQVLASAVLSQAKLVQLFQSGAEFAKAVESDSDEPPENDNAVAGVSTRRSSAPFASQLCAQTSLDQEEPTNYVSQYLKDFEPIEVLGRGGFGVVFQAKKNIDEKDYAVKRITLPKKQKEQTRVMREVTALAKLDHPNIVRYFHAWTESPPSGWLADNDPLWSMTKSTTRGTETSFTSEPTSRSNATHLKTSFMTLQSHEETITSPENTDGNSQLHSLEVEYLYIQQELCEKHTLHDWLRSDVRTSDPTFLTGIFTQIISAVEYFHSQNLIHRDLKPGNIFFAKSSGKSDLVLKVGDFGLVRDEYADAADGPSLANNFEHVNLTSRVGTPTYMSPEQNVKQPYNHKVDIYSLGIIFFEVLAPFSTEMERQACLSEVRQRIFPHGFSVDFPEQFKLIRAMVSHDPTERPNAGQVKHVLDTFISMKDAFTLRKRRGSKDQKKQVKSC